MHDLMRYAFMTRLWHWRAVALGALALVAGTGPTSVPHSPTTALERAVQANFLSKFAPFIEWPAESFSAVDHNFGICVTGDDPFGHLLSDAVRGLKLANRPVVIRRLMGETALAGCHILFAGPSTAADYAPFAAVEGKPVLTVSDRQAGPSGAMIEFVRRNGRVRFQINEGAARAHGLKISSKLLGLAIAVDRK